MEDEKKETFLTLQSGIKDIVKKKILHAKLAQKTLQHQVMMCNASVRLNKLNYGIAKAKQKLVKQLETLYEQQLVQFTSERQAECHRITEEINTLDEPTEDAKKYMACIDKHRGPFLKQVDALEKLDSSIPDNKSFKQWVLKFEEKKKEKDLLTANPDIANTCAKEAMGFGQDLHPDTGF